jgi:hypothetical protein
MLQSLEAAFASLKDQVLGANLNWLPKASLTELGITQLSSDYSPSEIAALTPKALDDFRQALLAGGHLPSASLTAPGIVQLVDSFTTPDAYKAATAKAVCDLRAYVGSTVDAAHDKLTAYANETAGDIRDQLTAHIDGTSASILSDLQGINAALEASLAALDTKLSSILSDCKAPMEESISDHNTDTAAHEDIRQAIEELDTGGGGYEPPVGGIPKSDLAQDVKDSLSLADSAISAEGGALTGLLTAGGPQAIGVAQVRNIVASTVDLTAGVSSLATGQVYLVYE